MSRRQFPLMHLTLARLREFYREPGAVFWVFAFPVLLAVALGVAFRHKPPERLVVGVIAAQGHDWIAKALAEADTVEGRTLNQTQARVALRTGAVDIVVVPTGPLSMNYRFDPMRERSQWARLAVDAILQRAQGRQDVLTSTEGIVSEPGGRYIDFLLPGLIGLNLMGSSMWGIGYSVVLSRKRRLLKRFAATPMRRSHFLLSYFFSRLAFLVLEVAAIVLFGYAIFDVGVVGSWFALSVVSLLGAASFAGIALLVAARTESIEAASGWLNFVMLPMWMLSGSFFAYSRFPEFLQPAIKALPLTALNDALRAVMSDGAALWRCWPEMAVLLAWGVFSFALAGRTFRWQ